MDYFMEDLARNFSELELQRFQTFCFDKAKRSSLEEKIQLTYEFLNSANVWPTQQSMRRESSKSAVEAAKFRLLGNAAFQRREYDVALNSYTKSVAVAPVGSEELAFAYANRSAVLISVEKYHECLLDINRAFKENYPEAGKQKLVDRKNKCIAHLRDTIERAKLLTPSHRFDFIIREMKELAELFDPEGTDLPSRVRLPKVDLNNKMIPNASDKVKLKNIRDNKISVVATANIKPGEILAIEKPVVWNLTEALNRMFCANCFGKSEALIPCPNCSVVMYCGASCRDEAFMLFHRIECEIFCNLNLSFVSGLLKSWLVVRLLLLVTKQGEKLDQIMDHPAYKLPLAKTFSHNLNEKFNSQNLSSIFCHSRLTYDRSVNDFSDEFILPQFRRVASWLYYLKQSTFFGDQRGGNPNSNEPLTKRELYVATLLLRLAQMTCLGVTEKVRILPDFDKKTCITVPLGDGLFPLINIFGHSCEPHVQLYCYGNNLVCRSIRPIKAGEEIFRCYFQPYHSCPRYERIAKLRDNHNFECICRPCQRNWPTADMLPQGFPKVISDSVGAKKFQEYSSRFRKLSGDVMVLGNDENVEFLCEYLQILEKRFEKPCREFIVCQHMIDLIFSLEGNFAKVK